MNNINNLSNIDKLSDVAFKEFMDKIISDIAKEIDNAKEKNNSKSNAGSQYTSPKPALHNNYEVSLEQKFQRKIKLRNNKQNKFEVKIYKVTTKDFPKSKSKNNEQIAIKRIEKTAEHLKLFTKDSIIRLDNLNNLSQDKKRN